MRFARHFIDRPVLAGVLSLGILLAGLVSLRLLPVAMFPEVVPPTIVVSASYPGANPKVVAETVAAPLEQEINGIDDIIAAGYAWNRAGKATKDFADASAGVRFS